MGQLNDPYSNVKQATKAAVELGLMPSIDPIDFHKRRLDKLSILTFVDQLYQNFKNAQRKLIFQHIFELEIKVILQYLVEAYHTLFHL